MKTDIIISFLNENAKRFYEIKQFSDKPGIYALFFYGHGFPITNCPVSNSDIIYIGKTEKSQQSRDADTHFSSGKTGSSTIRKSFGSLLRTSLNLTPVPRGEADIVAGRLSAFKFSEESEEKLTKWMIQNLGLSFFEYDKTPYDIDVLETQLIEKLNPVLNIDRKNPFNPFAPFIKQERKKAASIAHKETHQLSTQNQKAERTILPHNFTHISNLSMVHKYEDIWRQALPDIIRAMGSTNAVISLDPNAFNKVGNRKSYAFNLEFSNGVVANNIGGSAVARDLARLLIKDNSFQTLAKGKHIKMNLDKYFDLSTRIH